MRKALFVLTALVLTALSLAACSESGGGASKGKVLRTVVAGNERTDFYYRDNGTVERTETVIVSYDEENKKTLIVREHVEFAEDGTVSAYEYTGVPAESIKIEGNRVTYNDVTLEFNKNGQLDYYNIGGIFERRSSFNDKGLCESYSLKPGQDMEWVENKVVYEYDEEGNPYVDSVLNENGEALRVDSYSFYIYGPAD